LCTACNLDYRDCDDCPGANEVPFIASDHPITPDGSLQCKDKTVPFDYYFYNADNDTFERCETNPDQLCLRCTAVGSCTSCVTGYVPVLGACVLASSGPPCRSPEVMTTYSSQCENCSTIFDTIEASEPGLCGGLSGSIVKTWEMFDDTEGSVNEKKRMLQLTGEHFDLIPDGDNSDKILISDELLSNKFDF
jgi:hypothetical protein